MSEIPEEIVAEQPVVSESTTPETELNVETQQPPKSPTTEEQVDSGVADVQFDNKPLDQSTLNSTGFSPNNDTIIEEQASVDADRLESTIQENKSVEIALEPKVQETIQNPQTKEFEVQEMEIQHESVKIELDILEKQIDTVLTIQNEVHSIPAILLLESDETSDVEHLPEVFILGETHSGLEANYEKPIIFPHTEIFNENRNKAFFGGFRNKNTGTEFHHAFTQTVTAWDVRAQVYNGFALS